MRPRRRRILALLGLAAAALLAAIAFGLFPQEPVRRLVEGRLRALLGPEARLGRLSVEPARLRATVEGLVLEGPAYRLEADHAQITLAASSLRGAGVHLRELRARGVRVLIRPAPAASPGAVVVTAPLWIDSLAVVDASVRYHDPALAGDIVLEGVSLHGSIGTGALDLEARGGRWERRPEVALAPARARLRLDPRLVTRVDSFEGGLPRSRLQASGELGPLLQPQPDLRLRASLDLEELGPLGGLGDARGLVHLTATVQGAQEPRVTATASAEALRLQGWPVDKAVVEIEHGPGGTSGSLDATLLGGRANGKGRWSGPQVEGRVRWEGVSLARLRQAGLLQAQGIEGRVGGGFELRGTRQRARLDAHAEIDGQVADGPRLGGRATATGPVSLAGGGMDLGWEARLEADADSGRLRRGHLDIHGTARGPWPPRLEAQATGELEVAAGDRRLALTPTATLSLHEGRHAIEATVAGLGAPIQLFLTGRGDRVERLSLSADGVELDTLLPEAHGRARLTASASGPWAALDGTASVQLTEAAWRQLVLGPASADVALRRGQVEATLGLPDLHARATLLLPPGARSTLQATIDLEATPFAPFAPLLPPAAADLSGALSARVTVAVPLAAPDRARGDAEVGALEAKRGPWSTKAVGPFRLGYQPGQVTVDALRLEGSGLQLEADGRAGTDRDGALDLRLRARAALGDAPVPEGWRLEGQAEADVTLTGQLRRPQARGHLALRSASLSAPAVPPVSVADGRIEVDGEAVVLPSLSAALAGGRLTLAGRVPLAALWADARKGRVPAPEEEAEATLEWADIDAATLLSHLAPGRGAGLEARLAGRAELRGGFASLSEPRVVVDIPLTPARFQELPLTLEAATLELRGGRVSTKGLRLATESGSLELAGQADLVQRQADLTGRGQLALRALSPFLREAALAGTAELDLEARGPFEAPRIEGALAIGDATVRLRAMPQPLTGLDAIVVFEGGRVEIQEARAAFGGGPVTLAGTARLSGTQLQEVRFTITGRDMAVRYPVGLRTRLDADLTLTGHTGALLLGGAVRAQSGLYDLDAVMTTSVAKAEPAPSPALRAIGLDLVLSTEGSIRVRGNIGQMAATGRLTLSGDMETPVPVGTLRIEEHGKIRLQSREFDIQRGQLVYAGTWNPALDILAEGEIKDRAKDREQLVKVKVLLKGTLERPEVRLDSEPLLANTEIISLIAAGDSSDHTARLSLGTEAANFLLGSRLSRSLQRLGFDEVSVQPELVTRQGTDEAEPGARFTFGKRLSSRAKLIYSLSLQDPEQRFIKIEVTAPRDITLSAQRSDAGNLGTGAGQTFRWGGRARRAAGGARRSRARLREVRLLGGQPLDAQELRRLLKVEEGDRRSIWQLQDDADRLREALVQRGFLEAEVDVRLEEGAAVFQVRTGPRYTWQVTGMTDPPDLGQEIRRALFEEEALELGRERLLRVLRERGHLRARVTTEVQGRDQERTLGFHVEPGPRLEAALRFPGATVFSEGRLAKIVGGPGRVLAEPGEAVADLVAAYRARHYLLAKVEPPLVVERPAGVDVDVRILEGPPARVAGVGFEGATRPESELKARVGLQPGQPYDEAAVLAASDALRAHYFGLGFASVRVSARTVPQDADLEVVFEIAEGRQARVGSVVVQGASRTRLGFVQDQIRLKPGDPLDPRAVSEVERRLLNLGVFSRVAVSVSGDEPAVVTVTVEEGERVVASYLLGYQQETNLNGEVRGAGRGDLYGELRNLFGRGLRLGGRYGRGTDIEDIRADGRLPAVWRQELLFDLSRRVESLPIDPAQPDGPKNERRQRAVHVQGQTPLSPRWSIQYGYRFRRSELRGGDFDQVNDVGGFDLATFSDTRDNVLDARRGRFLTLAIEYAPTWFGLDFTFVKGLATLSVATPLSPSWTWAHGYRLGLAQGLRGQRLISFDRFQAGGANSVRGFATNRLGPLSEPVAGGGRDPLGGQAVAIFNQELRYHHARTGLGAVAFYDAGNVFATKPSLDLRHALGFGLRWESPVGLLRVDLGFPLRPRPERDEKSPQVFLSIGQAF